MLDKLKKIEKTIFYLLILFLPTQLGRHFWPDFSYVYGIRIDYLSPTIYLTDVLVFLLFLTFLSKAFFKKQSFKNLYFNFKNKAWLFVWLFLLISGIIISKSPMAGLYGILKIIEYVFLGFYAVNFFKEKNILKTIIYLLFIGVIFESSLAIAQFINQGSLNGIFYLLGERSFSGQTIGIANASLNGELILRPYATFPHPNLLAAYLLFSLLFILFFLKDKKKIIYFLTLIIGGLALLLTMSRVAIVMAAFLIIVFLIKKGFKKQAFIFLIISILIIIFSPLKYRFININFSDLAIVQRKELILASLLMARDNFIIGVGINNYFFNLPNYLTMQKEFFFQPVHNIFLLILAQTGILGLIFFLWFFKKTYFFIKEKTKTASILFFKLTLFFLVLTIGFFDHYFLTLQQGQLLLTFIFSFLWSDVKSLS